MIIKDKNWQTFGFNTDDKKVTSKYKAVTFNTTLKCDFGGDRLTENVHPTLKSSSTLQCFKASLS